MRLLFWITLYVLLVLATAGARRKRVLAFQKGSSFFFRLNCKINIIPNSTIFAHAVGFKVAWELPNGRAFRNGRSIRDIHENMELMYESHGFNGKSCLWKNICEIMERVEGKDGILGKIMTLLKGSLTRIGTSIEDPINCKAHANLCPLVLTGVNKLSGI